MRRAKSKPRSIESPPSLLFDDEPLVPSSTRDSIIILPPRDVMDTLRAITQPVTTTILDPWYNKGVGGVRPDYHEWLSSLVKATAEVSDHIFLWGFPEIVYQVLDDLPRGFVLIAWLTWYYKNCPSVIRGWRSSQLACRISPNRTRDSTLSIF